MQNLKITLVQAEQTWEQKEQNLAHYEVLLQSIEGTDIIVLPEMFHTGFTMNADMAEFLNENKDIEVTVITG